MATIAGKEYCMSNFPILSVPNTKGLFVFVILNKMLLKQA